MENTKQNTYREIKGFNDVGKEVYFQTGIEKNPIRDSRIKALAPGKRISKTGKVYWETRVSRSDINGLLK